MSPRPDVPTRGIASLVAGWLEAGDSVISWVERLLAPQRLYVVIPAFGDAEGLGRILGEPATLALADGVVVVDDATPHGLLRDVVEVPDRLRGRVAWIRNRRNLGFVRAVNVGFRSVPDDADVVVLNSDARLAAASLARLRVAASSQPHVASVSPVSNAAGFFSLPTPGVDAELDLEEISRLNRWLLWHHDLPHEEAVTTSGFCWYLRAEAREVVGVFDEQLIHRGYGEESDYCLRARDAGFINLVCLHHVVGHLRGATFGPEKELLKRSNAAIVKALFPGYARELAAYEQRSALHDLTRVLKEDPSVPEADGVDGVRMRGAGLEAVVVRDGSAGEGFALHLSRAAVDERARRPTEDGVHTFEAALALALRFGAARVEVSSELQHVVGGRGTQLLTQLGSWFRDAGETVGPEPRIHPPVG